MKALFQHTAISHGIAVRVAVSFLPDQSEPENGKWFWVYHIRIENHSHEQVQLLTRHWRITDGRGGVAIVDGEGLVIGAGTTAYIRPHPLTQRPVRIGWTAVASATVAAARCPRDRGERDGAPDRDGARRARR